MAPPFDPVRFRPERRKVPEWTGSRKDSQSRAERFDQLAATEPSLLADSILNSQKSAQSRNGPLRPQAAARRPRSAAGSGEVAEREGFEPSERLRAQRFSRPPRSTTPAPLRGIRPLADRGGRSTGEGA